MSSNAADASGSHKLATAIESRAIRMMETGYRGYNLYSLDAREALVAVILTTWPVNESRSERARRREISRRDKTIASLRHGAVQDSDWLVWGRDYFLWRPWYSDTAEYEFRKASLDIVADGHGVRNRNAAWAMKCWSVISIGAEVVRISLARLDDLDEGQQAPALDEHLSGLTSAALVLADACLELSETPLGTPGAQSRRIVERRLAARPTAEVEWLTLVEQLDSLISRCREQLAFAGNVPGLTV